MDKLWAPWRMEYIMSEKPDECIFCAKPRENKDRKNFILYRGKLCFVIMNYYPYNNGHLMVVPYRHTSELTALDEEERAEMFDVVVRAVSVLKAINPHGMNIGMNLGRTAGAGIDDHLHFHVVPRWDGDTNFMPVTGHTKVISQGLNETWDVLKPIFE